MCPAEAAPAAPSWADRLRASAAQQDPIEQPGNRETAQPNTEFDEKAATGLAALEKPLQSAATEVSLTVGAVPIASVYAVFRRRPAVGVGGGGGAGRE